MINHEVIPQACPTRVDFYISPGKTACGLGRGSLTCDDSRHGLANSGKTVSNQD